MFTVILILFFIITWLLLLWYSFVYEISSLVLFIFLFLCIIIVYILELYSEDFQKFVDTNKYFILIILISILVCILWLFFFTYEDEIYFTIELLKAIWIFLHSIYKEIIKKQEDE